MISEFLTGFFVSMWIGAFLGSLSEWNSRAFVAILFGIGTVVVVSSLLQPPSETAASLNWPFVIGTLPGYMLSFPVGKALYREHWKNSTGGESA